MGVQKRAVSVTVAAITNATLGVNTAVLLTITEQVFDTTGATSLSEPVVTGIVIPMSQLSYSHTHDEDEADTGNLVVKNGEVDVLSINGNDYDPTDESDWTHVKREAIWNELYASNIA